MAGMEEAPVLKSIRLENFKCFREMEVPLWRESPLGGNWTCLVGVNGAGKTSVLQGIALLTCHPAHPAELGQNRLISLESRSRSQLEKTLIEAEGQYLALTSGSVKDLSQWHPERLVLAYGATRTLSSYIDSRFVSLSERMRRILTLFEPHAPLSQVESLLVQANRDRTPILRLLRSLVSILFEGRLSLEWGHSDQPHFQIEGVEAAAWELPDGFRSCVAWLADLCANWVADQRERGQREPGELEDMEALVLIDEIDLHLHPSLQRSLVPALRRAMPKVQWVVTTHSPLMIANFDKSEIVALDRNAPGGIRNLDRQTLSMTVDQIIEWLMETPASSREIEKRAEAATGVVEQTELVELMGTFDTNHPIREYEEYMKRLSLADLPEA